MSFVDFVEFQEKFPFTIQCLIPRQYINLIGVDDTGRFDRIYVGCENSTGYSVKFHHTPYVPGQYNQSNMYCKVLIERPILYNLIVRMALNSLVVVTPQKDNPFVDRLFEAITEENFSEVYEYFQKLNLEKAQLNLQSANSKEMFPMTVQPAV